MKYIDTTDYQRSTNRRKTKSLFNWLSKIAGVETCWIETIDESNKPIWGFIKKLTHNLFYIHARVNKKRLAGLALGGAILFLNPTVQAQTAIELSALRGANGSTFNGVDSDDESGMSQATGDINGDGVADLIIGAPFGDPSGTLSGETYIVFGNSNGFGDSIDLSSLDGSTGFVLNGSVGFQQSGRAVTSGDINGDGFDDVIIGAPLLNSGGVIGRTYVIFGKSSFAGSSSIDISDVADGTNGFTLNGINDGDRSGGALATGDINGDSFDDLIIGAFSADESYVVFGKSSFTGSSSIDLSSLDGSTGFLLSGNNGDESGISVASGDINGDNIDDVIVGARSEDANSYDNSGATYVVFGKSSFAGSSSIDLKSLDESESTGFVLNGVGTNDYSGDAVSSGDINGDNIDDVIIGASLADSEGGSLGGQTYVFFGKSSFAGSSSINLSSLDGSTGFVLSGIGSSDNSGAALASGDINTDGFDEVIVGAPGGDPNSGNSGETYVIFGKSSFAGSSFIELSSLNGTTGFALNGFDGNGDSGEAIATGDINGDGTDDIIIGAPEASGQSGSSGQTYVFYNKASQLLTGDAGFRTLGAPVSGTVYNELLEDFFTQGFTGSDAEVADDNVWSFDQATQAFVALSNQDTDNLAAGNGFLFFAFSDDNGPNVAGDAGFPKRLSATQFGGDNTANSGTVAPVSDLDDSDFFFAGNPYSFAIDWDDIDITKTNLAETIYIYDDANEVFQNWNGTTGNITDGLIEAFQGFFIQGNGGSGALSITEDAIAATDGTFFKAVSEQPSILKISATADGRVSDAWISFQQGGRASKDRFDGLFLQPLGNEYLRLATITDTQDMLSINALPVEQEQELVLPLDLSGTISEDTAVLSFEGLDDFDGWDILIRDRKTNTEYTVQEGESIDLEIASINTKAVPNLTHPTPTPMKAKTSSTRYELVLQPGVSVNTEEPTTLPTEVALDQNFPNPFNPSTNISFALPQAGNVRLEVFDLLGRRVSTLINARQAAGRFTVNFDASALSSGVYIYRLQARGAVLTRKLTLIK